jgi:hypothetical protein
MMLKSLAIIRFSSFHYSIIPLFRFHDPHTTGSSTDPEDQDFYAALNMAFILTERSFIIHSTFQFFMSIFFLETETLYS